MADLLRSCSSAGKNSTIERWTEATRFFDAVGSLSVNVAKDFGHEEKLMADLFAITKDFDHNDKLISNSHSLQTIAFPHVFALKSTLTPNSNLL